MAKKQPEPLSVEGSGKSSPRLRDTETLGITRVRAIQLLREIEAERPEQAASRTPRWRASRSSGRGATSARARGASSRA